MKVILCTSQFILLTIVPVFGQETDSIARPKFEHNVSAFLYVKDKEYFFSPVYLTNKNKLHLELRYNYEEAQTISGWVGYNFRGSKKIKYFITPMAGFLAGNLRGLSPGIEVDFEYKDFEFNSETEYIFAFSG